MCINTCLSKVQTKVCAGTQHHASKLVYMLLPKRVAQIDQNEAQASFSNFILEASARFYLPANLFKLSDLPIYSTTLILASLTFEASI